MRDEQAPLVSVVLATHNRRPSQIPDVRRAGSLPETTMIGDLPATKEDRAVRGHRGGDVATGTSAYL